MAEDEVVETPSYDEEDTSVIIDQGSGMCKAGLSPQEFPSLLFPQAVGWKKTESKKSGKTLVSGNQLLGDDAYEYRISYPIEDGIIDNMEHMEELWRYTYNELGVDSSAHSVLITEPPLNPMQTREDMVEALFETFKIPSLCVAVQGVLALIGAGRLTGLVLDSGDGVTHTVPIYEGYALPHCIRRLNIAGRDLTTFMAKMISQNGTCLTSTWDRMHVGHIKETYCYVAPKVPVKDAEEAHYTLPDGRVVGVKDERWKCPEALFHPSMLGYHEALGLPALVHNCIQHCDMDLRKVMYSNIVLSGGSTTFPGLRERLVSELGNVVPSSAKASIHIADTEHRQFAVWQGGKLHATVRKNDEAVWFTKEEYNEEGPGGIVKKLMMRNS